MKRIDKRELITRERRASWPACGRRTAASGHGARATMIVIYALGEISGARANSIVTMNPARTLGPLLLVGGTPNFAGFRVRPLLGAGLAV